MEPYLESIDPDRNLIEAFVADYYRHGLVDVDTLVWPRENIGKPTFYFHEDTFEPPIAEEIRGPFMDAYYLLSRIPLMPEMTDPIFAGLLRRGWNMLEFANL
ncbi:uncharacterized protein N7458_005029 [Penicillium daleae]|uniref:Uncharacterized protein n=1 Tax=Penicillium daleae TaxID=63821 RepID=A0AAD6G3G6_9EURO|nr:uncharacterized protein N7458_005029 [Penicillium daleae]KAJ5454073.1 hypothetical protein N7458_005029 [Penicillium daleae]